MEDYSWIGTLVGTLATTAGGITETVISGKNKRTEIEAGANIEQTTKSQNSNKPNYGSSPKCNYNTLFAKVSNKWFDRLWFRNQIVDFNLI